MWRLWQRNKNFLWFHVDPTWACCTFKTVVMTKIKNSLVFQVFTSKLRWNDIAASFDCSCPFYTIQTAPALHRQDGRCSHHAVIMIHWNIREILTESEKPSSLIILSAVWVALHRSELAPALTFSFPKTISSAIRPPIFISMSTSISALFHWCTIRSPTIYHVWNHTQFFMCYHLKNKYP
mgnify:FL=1